MATRQIRERFQMWLKRGLESLAMLGIAGLILLYVGFWVAGLLGLGWFTWTRWEEFTWRDFISIATLILVWTISRDLDRGMGAVRTQLSSLDSTLEEIARPVRERERKLRFSENIRDIFGPEAPE